MSARWNGWTSAAVEERFDIDRGHGSHVWDAHGRRYLDGVAGSANTPFGHTHPTVTEAVTQQLARLAHMDETLATQRPAQELADVLAELTGLDDVVFVNSGSEAIEAAVRIAMDYWQHRGQPQRDTVVCFADGYHGCTALTASLSGLPILRTDWVHGPRVQHVALTVHHQPAQPGAVQALAADFAAALRAADPQRVAAVLVEPFLNVGGGIVLPDGFLTELRTLTRHFDCLMIVDEVFTGFGRNGRAAFAINAMPDPPDLLAISKGMTNGVIPMGATCLRHDLRAHYGDAPLRYGHTTSGHSLACAAALATIDLLRTDGLAHAAATADWLATHFAQCLRVPGITDARTYGAVGIAECDTAERATALAAHARRPTHGDGLLIGCKQRSLLLTPALNVPTSQLAEMVDRLRLAATSTALTHRSVPA